MNQSGRMIGPLSTVEMALAAKNLIIKSQDEIWRMGLPRWYKAGEIGGLIPRDHDPELLLR